jgi:hypothetical protein
MPRSIHLFVSSSPNLAPEREALGQTVAELPVSSGWEIKHTPGPDEDVSVVFDFIQHCDLFVLMLGADFAAPMGVEWQQARGAHRSVLAYRKRVLHSPSAQQLLRESHLSWTEFESPQDFKGHLSQALVKILLDGGEQFGLHLGDVEALLKLIQSDDEEAPGEPDRRRGAGRGGVILDRRA